jgi:hypothetical protein
VDSKKLTSWSVSLAAAIHFAGIGYVVVRLETEFLKTTICNVLCVLRDVFSVEAEDSIREHSLVVLVLHLNRVKNHHA